MSNSPRPALRLAAAASLATLAAAAALFLLASGGTEPGATGSYAIAIIGPGGDNIWNGTVHADNATALSVLHAAAEAGGFDITVQDYGVACGLYVRGIAGHVAAETDPTGWVYEVRNAGSTSASGDWIWADRSADCYPLSAGQELRWRWSESR